MRHTPSAPPRWCRSFCKRRVPGSGEAIARCGVAVDIVDLMQWMPTVEPHTDVYYLPCDGHWNAAGNRIAAEALSAASHRGPEAAHAERQPQPQP